MNRRYVTLRATCAIATMLIGILSGTGIAQASDNASQVHVETKTTTININGAIKKKATADSLETDPPGGGCTGIIQFNTTGYYLNGKLTDTATPYYGNVSCTTTADGQFMAELSAHSVLLLNDAQLSNADPSVCYDAINCTSTSRGYCIEPQQTCSGTYYATNEITMLLPDGWYWTSLPDGCSSLGPPEVICFLKSTSAYIPPFYS